MTDTTEQSGDVRFRARARLIQLLGEELISNEVVALIELVKNAYDADASSVLIRIGPNESVQPSILVRDNGVGMSLDTVLTGWMEPAGSTKRSRGRKVRTPGGRLPLGEKGVGRFAAHKLGQTLHLVTREPGAPLETVLQVEWHQFEENDYLDDVGCRWHTRVPTTFPDRQHGTELAIDGLRTSWEVVQLRRLHDGLSRLTSPHARVQGFRIQIEARNFPDFSGDVTNSLLNTAPHGLTGRVDETGMLCAHRQDGTPVEVDLCGLYPDHFKGPEPRRPQCGPFDLTLRVWDLDALAIPGAPVLDRTTRAALRRSNGVSLYRDGFRVLPYGEPGNDWLELNQRRVNNPTLRVSNNQVVGIVEITDEGNPDLRDRTSREGLVDTPAYFDLRALVLGALAVVEEHRFMQRHPRSMPVQTQERDLFLGTLDSFRENPQLAGGQRAMLKQLEAAYQQTAALQLQQASQTLKLAGAGIAAERILPELARTLDSTRIMLQQLQNELTAANVGSAADRIDELRTQHELLDHLLDLSRPLYRASHREIEELSVLSAVGDVLTILANSIDSAGISVRCTGDPRLKIRMNEGQLMQVLLALLDNAINAASSRTAGSRSIHVHVAITPEPSFVVADSGPGIPGTTRDLIFKPFFSGRTGSRGLGLFIVRSILDQYDSRVFVDSERGLLDGAHVRVQFASRIVVRNDRKTGPDVADEAV